MVRVTVNGRPVDVPRGAMLLQATSKAHMYVPTLCKHPRLPNTPGSCRVCMVEVNGVHKPACCTPVSEGAVIKTDTPEVRAAVAGSPAGHACTSG